MFNHKQLFEADAGWAYDTKRKGFVVMSLREIKKGKQICFPYGNPKSNSNLFLGYGFVQVPNADD